MSTLPERRWEGAGASSRARVVVLADDLIWSTRIAALVREAGGEPVLVRSFAAFTGETGEPGGAWQAIVDMTSRAYDPIDAVRVAHDAGVAVLAVGQHDLVEQRRAARAAGASRVVAYRQLAENGVELVSAWLAEEHEGPEP